jgi:large subunit ribosomal protein L13
LRLLIEVKTFFPKGEEVEARRQGQWVVLDARDQVLGRLATRAARILIGKDNPRYIPYQISGDHVVIVNAEKIRLTGRKLEQKVYRRHSGYPGGFKEVSLKHLKETRPVEVVREAVLGMLPKNRLRARLAKRLRIYVGEQHPHAAQKPVAAEAGKS